MRLDPPASNPFELSCNCIRVSLYNFFSPNNGNPLVRKSRSSDHIQLSSVRFSSLSSERTEAVWLALGGVVEGAKEMLREAMVVLLSVR